MDPFTVAYVSGAATLTVAELWAVLRRHTGDTITEKTKQLPLTHAVMGSLLVWGVHHFITSEWINHWVLDVAIAVLGGWLGWQAHKRRIRKGR